MRAIVRNRQVFVLAVGLAAAPLLAGPPPAPPPFYAIEGARVEVGDGTVLERATVVIENGTITAVGEDAAIPAHAWVIDGEGLAVHPGLIDAMGSLPRPRRPPGGSGAAAPTPGGQRRRPDPDRTLPRGPEDRPLTTPWKRAADDLALDADAVAAWRKAGVTSIAARPGDGLFPGRLSLVRLGAPGRDPEHQVIAPELAQMASLSGGGFGRLSRRPDGHDRLLPATAPGRGSPCRRDCRLGGRSLRLAAARVRSNPSASDGRRLGRGADPPAGLERGRDRPRASGWARSSISTSRSTAARRATGWPASSRMPA